MTKADGTRSDQTEQRSSRVLLVMARTNIDIDDESCTRVMKRFGLTSKREAVNLALRRLADEPLDLRSARAMRGTGWDGDLDEMRTTRSL